MRREIRALQQRLGITMIYVTHDQTEAMSMADRVILMSGGRIEQNGTPADLYERPATLFAARFIGAPPMNLVSTTRPPARRRRQRGPGDPRASEGDARLRPEDVRSLGAASLRVAAVEYLGADSLVDLRRSARRRSLAARAAARRARRRRERSAGLACRGDAHVFDAATGRRASTAADRDATAAPQVHHANSGGNRA